jgi:hypothetical protein
MHYAIAAMREYATPLTAAWRQGKEENMLKNSASDDQCNC